MGKADIYVFLIILAVIALIAGFYGLVRLFENMAAAAHERRRSELERTTPWSHYLKVGQQGEYVIGVQRWVQGFKPFEGPVEICRLPHDRDLVDVNTRVNEAKDRANLLNETRNI
jgi:hypothetical protein